jgi:hypothetical protein
MSATVPVPPPAETPPAWEWPAEVIARADEAGVREYLEPLRRATLGLFPNARLCVLVEQDPEIAEERMIVFEAHVPERNLPHPLVARKFWFHEFRQIVPAPLSVVFRLMLTRVPG